MVAGTSSVKCLLIIGIVCIYKAPNSLAISSSGKVVSGLFCCAVFGTGKQFLNPVLIMAVHWNCCVMLLITVSQLSP